MAKNRQKLFGVILLCVALMILAANLMYGHFFKPGGIDANFFTLDIIVLVSSLPIIMVTCLWESIVFEIIQCIILYCLGAIAIFININSFRGWGLFTLSVSLAYLYHFLDRRFLLKTLVPLSILICLGVTGEWYEGIPFFSGLYFFIIIFFFVLLGSIVFFIVDEKKRKMRALEAAIENQNAMLHKLSFQTPDSVIREIEDTKQAMVTLTLKEKQLLEVYCNSQGSLKNKELADILETTENSIKSSFLRIRKKLGVNSRAQLCVRYHEMGEEVGVSEIIGK
ncbi:regulatory protein LuxR [Parasphaerochaeta coccoides DSM 17374]|uniref:Regulatory protein LuxR n=2 Tax=Parasphaerochaeta TaxID=3062336 RepID=F4GIP0_PARC1|nr:regulatory protein LuxR [Parasphaerochaeta coccoides DSM 17374]